MLDAAKLAKMKSGAVLINVARGKIVDEQALYEALRDKVIGGAIIDAWYRYPFEPGNDETTTPSQFPFAQLDNVYMTPHCSAWTRPLLERRWQFVAANLDRYARAEPLLNVIHPA
jgi:phosphoglycerate dehydrogenase-like enzyme